MELKHWHENFRIQRQIRQEKALLDKKTKKALLDVSYRKLWWMKQGKLKGYKRENKKIIDIQYKIRRVPQGEHRMVGK